jgi:hypothetical protein
LEEIHPNLANIETFQVENGEKKVIVAKGNFLYMLICSVAMVVAPIILLFLVPYMEFARAALSIIIAIPAFIFAIYATVPVFGQFLRGRCVMRIADGQLKNHKISVPVKTIKTVTIKKHPNPLKLWIYDYLVVTDVNNKKHYFNLYNMTRKKTVLSMIDVYVFNKKEI